MGNIQILKSMFLMFRILDIFSFHLCVIVINDGLELVFEAQSPIQPTSKVIYGRDHSLMSYLKDWRKGDLQPLVYKMIGLSTSSQMISTCWQTESTFDCISLSFVMFMWCTE